MDAEAVTIFFLQKMSINTKVNEWMDSVGSIFGNPFMMCE